MLVSPRIPQIQQLTEVNASYTMIFPGPMVQCQESNITNVTSVNRSDLSEYVEHFSDPSEQGVDLETGQMRWTLNETFELSRLYSPKGAIFLNHTDRSDGYLTVSPRPQMHTNETGVKYNYTLADNITLIWTVRQQECFLATAEYTVEVTNDNGLQRVRYTTGTTQSLPHLSMVDWRQNPVETFPTPLRSWEEYYNIMALFDSMTMSFAMSGADLSGLTFSRAGWNTTGSYRFSNGTDTETCVAEELSDNNPYASCESDFPPQTIEPSPRHNNHIPQAVIHDPEY